MLCEWKKLSRSDFLQGGLYGGCWFGVCTDAYSQLESPPARGGGGAVGRSRVRKMCQCIWLSKWLEGATGISGPKMLNNNADILCCELKDCLKYLLRNTVLFCAPGWYREQFKLTSAVRSEDRLNLAVVIFWWLEKCFAVECGYLSWPCISLYSESAFW